MNQNNDLPEGFKMTELGPLPKEWDVVRLGDVVNTKKGKKPEKLEEEWKENYLPYLTADYFRTGKPKQFVKLEAETSYITVGENDVIFIWDGSNAGDVFTGLKGVLASTMVVINPKENLTLTKQFLFYFMKTKFELFNSKTTGSTIPHVSKSLYENLLIPFPPLREQKKIAAVLSAVQEAREKTEAVIQATKELKKSMMKHLFTYGPVPPSDVDSVPLKETEIGMVPEGWEVVQLGDVFEIQQGKSLSPKSRAGSRKLPFLRTANVFWGHIDISSLDKMHFEEAEEERLALKPKDLLVCEGGEIGRTAMWEGQIPICLYQNHLHRLRTSRTDAYPLFYMYWMQVAWTILGTYGGAGNKTTIPNLSQSRLSSLSIPLPPLSEQKKIATVLSAIDNKIQAEENKKKSLDDLFKTLLNDLMTAKIRVNHLNLGVE
ncbi:MAG: restriction endonuclease subunit S [Thermoplasmata archaeon]